MKPMLRIVIAGAMLAGPAPVTTQQTARDQLIVYLTGEAARQTHARAATLASITTPEQA